MGKRVQVHPHHDVETLEQRYRNCMDGIERTHWQIIWLIARGKTPKEAADITGYTARWVREIVARYNQRGEDGLGDHRKDNEGVDPLLSPEEVEELRQALRSPPPDGGLWNSTKVARWISAKLGREVGRQRGWDYLKKNSASL